MLSISIVSFQDDDGGDERHGEWCSLDDQAIRVTLDRTGHRKPEHRGRGRPFPSLWSLFLMSDYFVGLIEVSCCFEF